ncbi:unnamed protein product [Schistocephalus solidus]|uniref:Monocarboxylate transporter 14 n=1 Tax=Schistocephalus solidus TaxID=70667 RepID=A0A183SG10_SCHSO|nr:unnamed protein product [Schistocephalus solidus]
MEPKPYKDRGWAWVVVFGAFLIHFLTAGSEKAYSVWYVEILEKYSANATWAASIGAISASVRLILVTAPYPPNNLSLYFLSVQIEVNISVLLLAVEGGVQVFARGLSGVLFDLACVKSHRGVVWCCIIIASSAIVCLLSVAKSLPIMVVLMALRGLCLAVYISHQTLMTCDMCEKSSGLVPHAIGLTQFFKGVGILVGSAISGWWLSFTC